MNIDYKLIGERIKQTRKAKGMTQEFLAEKLGVSIGYVSQIERGVTKISLDLLGAVSAILSCDVSELVKESALGSEHYRERELANEFAMLDMKKKKFLISVIRAMKEDL